MLKLSDFFHLPQVEALVRQVITDPAPGLIVAAGLDPRPYAGDVPGFLPGGRAAIFRILLREMLLDAPRMRCIVVAEERAAVSIPRRLANRVDLALVQPPYDYPSRLQDALRRKPGLLVIDALTPKTLPYALEAAERGLRVLSQADTAFRGSDVVRDLLELGAPANRLRALRWVLSIHRLETLCPQCKQPRAADPALLARLRTRYPDLRLVEDTTCYQAPGCPHCEGRGRKGSMAAFDVFKADPAAPDPFDVPSLLPMEQYVYESARLGHFALEDVLHFEADLFRRTYQMFLAGEKALADSKTALESRVAQLEAAHRVLEQRTRALVSLQEMGQALITSTDLNELGSRVCRHARDLCGADRAILYLRRGDPLAEVLAVSGWERDLLGQQFPAGLALDLIPGDEPVRYNRWPPGVAPRDADTEGFKLRAGLYVPLVAQGERVGLMVVHSTFKPRFEPGEVALLQTFASQAALAIQRAGLFEQQLRNERLERELELARQVQQSVLRRTFPQVEGLRFAAHYEPARQVGGDFYDVIALDDEHVGVAIGDVSDKGMPSALYMALTRSLLLAEARQQRSPMAVLRSVNALLQELGEPEMFVTVFYGVLARPSGRLTYARAGHDYPLLLRGGQAQELGGKGLALGLFNSDLFFLSEETVDLAPGDRLVLYSDGLTDVNAPDGALFDRERLKTLLRSCATMPPEGMCASVIAHLLAYQASAEQYDDMTLLVVGVE